jgi:hypothetical protein
MRSRTRILLAALSAAALLSVAIATADAARLESPNWEKGVRMTWSDLRLSGGGHTIFQCAVTMEGTVHQRTYSKVEFRLIGYVTRSSVGACTGGTATVLTERLPWHLQYESFEGVLPNITALNLLVVGIAVRLREGGGLECLFGTTATNPMRVIGIVTGGSGGEINTVRADETTAIPLGGEFLCALAGNASFTGAGNVTVLGETARVRIRLI